jgi:hypothetical protein
MKKLPINILLVHINHKYCNHKLTFSWSSHSAFSRYYLSTVSPPYQQRISLTFLQLQQHSILLNKLPRGQLLQRFDSNWHLFYFLHISAALHSIGQLHFDAIFEGELEVHPQKWAAFC